MVEQPSSSNPLTPLFELESGKAVSGAQISEALKLGASDLGLDPRRYATNSLRRGGATAMVAAGNRSHPTMGTTALRLLAPLRIQRGGGTGRSVTHYGAGGLHPRHGSRRLPCLDATRTRLGGRTGTNHPHRLMLISIFGDGGTPISGYVSLRI